MRDDLISRDAVLTLFATRDGKHLYDAIRKLPAIERPKGKWIEIMYTEDRTGMKCSECGYRYGGVFGSNYCPNCGADMRGGTT